MFRVRLYGAKNEAPEEEAELVLFRKDPRNPGEYQQNFIRGGSRPPWGPTPQSWQKRHQFRVPFIDKWNPFHIHLGRQNHNDKPVRFSGIFIFFMSRPGSVKSWIPSFKTNGKVIEKIKKENKNRKIKWWIIFARYFSFQHKPSSTGAKKEKWIQTQDERYICEILIHRKRKWFI